MKFLYAAYAAVSYLVFLASFVYAIGFVGDFGVPVTIDHPGGPGGWLALLIDSAVLGLFAMQHSVMARPAFKRVWTRIVPATIERSTYVLFSSLLLVLVFVAWRPLPGMVWDLRGSSGGTALVALQMVGWLVVVLSTFMISHFELFGLTQVWRRWRGRPAPEPTFRTVLLYRFVRHPIMLGFLIAFWATPAMSHGHLLFALLSTGYILVGTRLEERDLMDMFGATYARYRERVPMLLPFFRRAPKTPDAREAQPR